MNDLEAIVREYLMEHLKARLEGWDLDDMNILQVDLIGSGVISSIGFIELITLLEEEFKIQLDFEEYDPASYTTIAGLADLAKKCKGENNE